MICRECGKNIPEGTFFCPHCGLPVNEAEQAAQADPAGAYQQPAAPVNNYVGQTVAVPQEAPVAAPPAPAPIMPQAQVDPLYQGVAAGSPPPKKKIWIPIVIAVASVIVIGLAVLAIVFAVKSSSPEGKAAAAVSEAAALFDAGQYDSAFTKYEEALKIEPQNVSIYRSYARALAERGLFDRAIDVLKDGITKTDSGELKTLLEEIRKEADSGTSESSRNTRGTGDEGSKLTTTEPTTTTTEATTTTTTTEPTTTTTALDKKPMYEAYKKFLSEKKKRITAYYTYEEFTYSDSKGWKSEYKENKNPIQAALVDLTGDDVNELVLILQGDNELSYDMVVYSYIDGKVKSVLKIKNIDVMAGGYSSYIVCKSKTKGEICIYTGRFDEEYSEAYTVYKWNGEKFKAKSSFGSYSKVNDKGDGFKYYYFNGDEKIKKDDFKKLIPDFDKEVGKILFFNTELDDALTKIYVDAGSKPAGMTYKQAVKKVESKLK